jgi:hypothetical protein
MWQYASIMALVLACIAAFIVSQFVTVRHS